MRIFGQMFAKHGQFEITEEMIGFTPEGFVRVWCNPNYCSNSPYNLTGSKSK